MKIYIDGDVNRYYVQMLCMVFFPGAKFSNDEPESENTPVLYLKADITDSSCAAEAKLVFAGRCTVGHSSAEKNSFSDRLFVKRAVGFAICYAGKEMFNYVPERGILTGVRPAKFGADLMRKCMEENASSESESVDVVKKILIEQYMVVPKKADLLINVAQNEARILDSLEKNSCSVYISIPFCPTRCAYCSFVSYSTKRLLAMIPEYLKRLCNDLRYLGNVIREIGKKIVTVYIGGGTPTVLDSEQLRILLDCVCESFDLSGVREFTLEAGRPDTVTKEKLDIAVANGVTRVSINPQTMNDDVLSLIGRGHNSHDFLRAYDIARNSGIACINTDLIAGLPGENFESFTRSMNIIDELRPENITVHTFSVKKSAEFHDDETMFSRTGGDVGLSVDYSQCKTKASGYFPYYMYKQKNTAGNLENVGYSLEGKEGLYNVFIMEEVHSIFAVGAGSVTKLVSDDAMKMKRIFMPKYPYEYLALEEEEAHRNYRENLLNFYMFEG